MIKDCSPQVRNRCFPEAKANLQESLLNSIRIRLLNMQETPIRRRNQWKKWIHSSRRFRLSQVSDSAGNCKLGAVPPVSFPEVLVPYQNSAIEPKFV